MQNILIEGESIVNICVVCWRPIQLMNIYNYLNNTFCNMNNNNVYVDIFFSDTMKKYHFDLSYIPSINNVYYYQEQLENTREKVRKLLLSSSQLKKELGVLRLKKYDCIIGTGYNQFFVRMCNCFRGAEVILVEDGIGTYMNDWKQRFQTNFAYRIMKIMHKGPLAITISNLYCYHPELMCIEKAFPVTQLPLLTSDIEKKARAVFGMEHNAEAINTRIIYFTADNTWERQFGFQEEILYEMIYNYKNDTILRFHPNREIQSYRDMQVDDTKQLWEFRCSAISKNHILIGIFSTAQFSPYLFYGKHYNIVFLYKLVFPTDSYLYQQCEKTVEIMKKDFPDIYVPESREEFHSAMEKLMSDK